MADRTPYPVRIVTPRGVVFEGDSTMLVASSEAGQLGLLARHEPLVAALRPGTTRVQLPGGEWRDWITAEGFAKTDGLEAIVLVEDAVAVDAIDVEHARSIIADADAELAEQASAEDVAASVASHRGRNAEARKAWGQQLLDAAGAGTTSH